MAGHICPWWLGYFLINPFRRKAQDPEKILGPYVNEGMTVLEVGPGMGFFTLSMARMVGEAGKIICVDIQEKMLAKLLKRAGKEGLSKRIETRICPKDSLGIDDLAGKIDFALLFAVVHEVPDPQKLMNQICQSLKPGGKLLFSEPKGHVKKENFEQSIGYALKNGLEEMARPEIKRSLSVLLGKK